MGRGADVQGLVLVPSPWHGWGAQTYLLAGGGGEAVLEEEAALLTQVLTRGARNDPFLVLVTLGRARRERSSARTDFCWPLGMAQCHGCGGAGLAGTPVLQEGSQGFVPACCCCKSRGLGELPGLEQSTVWSWQRMHRLRQLRRAAVPAVSQAGPSPRGGRDRSRQWL